jgi:hypothetical protein
VSIGKPSKAGKSLTRVAVSIDEHPVWVYAIDGRFIVPQLVDVSIPGAENLSFLTSFSGFDSPTWKPSLSNGSAQ